MLKFFFYKPSLLSTNASIALDFGILKYADPYLASHPLANRNARQDSQRSKA